MKAEDLKKEIEEDYKKWKKFMEATKSDEQKGYEIDRKIMFNNGFLAGQNYQKEKDLEIVKKMLPNAWNKEFIEELTQKIKGDEE
jgi:ribosomal protein L4